VAVSFEVDIRPLFRDSPDVDSLQGCGLDLSSYEDVRTRAAIDSVLTGCSRPRGPLQAEIYASLEDGACPAMDPGLQSSLALSNDGWMRVSPLKPWPSYFAPNGKFRLVQRARNRCL
jgi:hypothetical protein